MCLLWVLPIRDLLPMLRKNPQLYHRAISQALPKYAFDYLQINPIGVSPRPEFPAAISPDRASHRDFGHQAFNSHYLQ